MDSIYGILDHILTLSEYQGDKSQFISGFIQSVKTQSLLSLFEILPENSQSEMRSQLELAGTIELAEEILLKYFTKEMYEQKLAEAVDVKLQGVLEQVWPTLPSTKQWELSAFLDSISSM